MKILYIATERRDAQLAAQALRGIAHNLTLNWAPTLTAANRWLHDNRDAAAVLVGAEQSQSCLSLLDHIRALGLTTPVVVVSPEHLEMAAAAKTRFLAAIERERGRCAALEAHLADAESARQRAEERHASELAAAAVRLTDTEAEYEATLARTNKICTALQHRLLELETALDAERQNVAETTAELTYVRERAAADSAAASDRCADLESKLAREIERRVSLQDRLSVSETARVDAEHRHASEAAAMASRLAHLEALYDTALTENAAARTEYESTLSDLRATLETAAHERGLESAAAMDRERGLAAQLHQESLMRATLERDLARTRDTSAHARRRFVQLAAAARRRARAQQAQLEAQLAFERATWECTVGARDEEIRRIVQERAELQRAFEAAQKQVTELHNSLESAREANARDRKASAAELERVSTDYERSRKALDEAQIAYNVLQRSVHEQNAHRVRLERVLADRDAQLAAQESQHRSAQHAAAETLARVRETLRQTIETSSADVGRLQREIEGLRRDLHVSRAEAESLRVEVERMPALQRRMEETRKESRRQFERAPYALFECKPDGTLLRANHSLARLIGYRKAEDLRGMDFAAAALECPADLRWLLERSQSTRTPESVETTLKAKDRRRLHVRLHALGTADGIVEVSVEDLTSLHALEQRLRQAQRLEAVGRLASEVAVTCDAVLRDVTHGGQQWLAAIAPDTLLRQQGELLLGEVARAAGYLRQFAVYGTKQVNALQPASVPRILRDLEPVLKRVAGDDIELLLPRTSAPFDVDVEAERLERILVNVASYARQRMSGGGRVKIDLANTLVDRRFTAKYPNVRPGNHVLITVSEIPATTPPALPFEPRAESGSTHDGRSDKPGVDVGVLLGLVGGCGGHLWMAAEPSGNMTLKIHLPRRSGDDLADPAAAAARIGRGRQLVKWLRHQAARD